MKKYRYQETKSTSRKHLPLRRIDDNLVHLISLEEKELP